ncbi:hypothetical protein BDW02DRAFT_106553 [Decorospora gaudefroyi]|uniref:Uncharacterized protein n=1 Tax=Decorospora gaudefroyi TaxID=184978 RepID=A0A6A5KKK7_9PLEO|nr:hypothetical protein BDW02DRAFT_106553 [Decorospora gaudefroyi]
MASATVVWLTSSAWDSSTGLSPVVGVVSASAKAGSELTSLVGSAVVFAHGSPGEARSVSGSCASVSTTSSQSACR